MDDPAAWLLALVGDAPLVRRADEPARKGAVTRLSAALATGQARQVTRALLSFGRFFDAQTCARISEAAHPLTGVRVELSPAPLHTRLDRRAVLQDGLRELGL